MGQTENIYTKYSIDETNYKYAMNETLLQLATNEI